MQRDKVTIVLGGDTGIMAPAYSIAKTQEKYASFINLLETADIIFVNLETALTDHEYPDTTFGANKGAPALVEEYASMGINIMSIGHKVFDYGNVGLMDSINALDATGIQHVGAGRNPIEARKEEVIEVQGQRIGFMKIGVHPPRFKRYEALIVYNAHQKLVLEKPGLALLYIKTVYEVDPEQGSMTSRTFIEEEGLQKLIKRIQSFRETLDFLILGVHWGKAGDIIFEYQTILGHTLIDAGVDVIAGCHPHRPQGIELYKGKPIFYSLGNFIYQRTGLTDYLGPEQCVARVQLVKNQISKIEVVPTICDSTFVQIADISARNQFIKKMKTLYSQFSTEYICQDKEFPISIEERVW